MVFLGRLCGPTGSRPLLVHVDEQSLAAPHTQGSGDVHADSCLAAPALLIEYRHDLGAH